MLVCFFGKYDAEYLPMENFWFDLKLLSQTDGLDVVDKIESVGSQSGATCKPVVIKESGEILD